MTTTPLEDADIGSALAILWQRHRQSILDRISLLESTSANVLRGVLDERSIAEGVSAAHKLAGSLGTFGFDAGSRSALEAESLLREPVVDGRLLAEAVMALRASVDDVTDPSESGTESVSLEVSPSSGATTQIVSFDAELISRLTVEANAIGLGVSSREEPPLGGSLSVELTSSLILDDVTMGSWTRPEMLASVAELSRIVPVVVLTDHDALDDRIAFSNAGAVGVIPRGQGARQIVSFLAELLAQREPTRSSVLVLSAESGLLEGLSDMMNELGCRFDVRNDPPSFWAALEAQGADLVITDLVGPYVSGPDLCRIIRAHSRWHRLPVIVIGGDDPLDPIAAIGAGADDYFRADVSPDELCIRLQSHLARGRLARTRSDTDSLTGVENRTAIERSLDRLLRFAARHNEPLALVLITIDGLDQVRETEGNALGDVVLRRLGRQLLDSFGGGEDVVGRWTIDGFAVGIYGATSQEACERVEAILHEFSGDGIPTTSGKLARFTFSGGIASSPIDGSTLSSLERLSEGALRRAKSGQNRVVIFGERSVTPPSRVVDVVLIEDDDAVADVVEHALNLRHYEFVRFSDGAEAARTLGEGALKGRVVLLDVGLPSLDGFGVLRTLRSQGVLEDTRVIMLTARSSEAEMLRALGLGATEHITKPFSIPILLGRLGQTLSRPAA